MPTYRLTQIPLPLSAKSDLQNSIAKAVSEQIEEQAFDFHIERLSLDSRRRGNPHFICNALFKTKEKIKKELPNLSEFQGEKNDDLDSEKLLKKFAPNSNLSKDVSIIGAGPAGLWAALGLLLKGFKVNLYEQGKPVEERFRDIRKFIKGGIFNPHSNILFGEGGAGTFSDGKLNARTRTEFTQAVLCDLIKAGENPEIAYLAKPHIGTDRLQFLIKKVRSWILELGGKIYFESELQDISIRNENKDRTGVNIIQNYEDEKVGSLTEININGKWLPCESLVIACGHSARKLYEILAKRGVKLEGKSFAIGARIEHPQKWLNEMRLGKGVDYSLTGAADYALTGKTAYSFCMCPGGVVVPCATESDGVFTNGMSYSRRNSPFANSALVTPVKIESADIKSGIELQREMEQKAFIVGGKNFSVPKQSAENFLNGKGGIWDVLSKNICENLTGGLLEFDKKIPGFIKNGLLIAPETRTSSPLQIVRNENSESVSVKGIFPIGEGAGYAGGILTSAADGLKLSCALAVLPNSPAG